MSEWIDATTTMPPIDLRVQIHVEERRLNGSLWDNYVTVGTKGDIEQGSDSNEWKFDYQIKKDEIIEAELIYFNNDNCKVIRKVTHWKLLPTPPLIYELENIDKFRNISS